VPGEAEQAAAGGHVKERFSARTPEEEIDSGIEQPFDDRLIPPVGGKAERAVGLAIPMVDIGAAFDEECNQISMSPQGGDVQGGAVVAVSGVDVRSGLQQQPGDLDVSSVGGNVDGQIMELIVVPLGQGIGMAGQDLSHQSRVTCLNGAMDVAPEQDSGTTQQADASQE